MSSAQTAADEFIEGFIVFSGGKLNYREDLERLIGLTFRHNNEQVLAELAFHAKYLNGLVRIIRNKDNKLEDEYFTSIKKEYTGHIEKVKELFLLIIEPASGFIKEIFKKKYLELSVESLERLDKFCEDLGKVKIYLNVLQEKGEGF
jgi:hypothetical protein